MGDFHIVRLQFRMHLIKIIALSVLLVGLVQAAPTNTAQDDPTEAPTTAKPTDAPTTAKPTDAPTTAKPTDTPKPTDSSSTAKPTDEPNTTAKPTDAPVTTDNSGSQISLTLVPFITALLCLFFQL